MIEKIKVKIMKGYLPKAVVMISAPDAVVINKSEGSEN